MEVAVVVAVEAVAARHLHGARAAVRSAAERLSDAERRRLRRRELGHGGGESERGGRQAVVSGEAGDGGAVRRRRVRLRRSGSLVDGRSDGEGLCGECGQFAEVELVRPGEAAVEEGGRVRLRRRRRFGRLGRAVGRRAAPGVGAVAVVRVGEP